MNHSSHQHIYEKQNIKRKKYEKMIQITMNIECNSYLFMFPIQMIFVAIDIHMA